MAGVTGDFRGTRFDRFAVAALGLRADSAYYDIIWPQDDAAVHDGQTLVIASVAFIGGKNTITLAFGYPENSVFAAEAAEDLDVRDLVNVYTAGGITMARRASAADTTKPARGFTMEFVSAGQAVRVHLIGEVMTGFTGLTPNAAYYLDVAPGAVSIYPPTTTNTACQTIGFALSDTALMFRPETPVKRA